MTGLVIRRKADQFEVTFITEFHESTAVASTIGAALAQAADLLQWPVPEGLPAVLDRLRTVPTSFNTRIAWTP
jgi:hypothetical protein